MSTRHEGADAAHTSTQHLAPRSWIGDVLLGPNEHALILGYDEVFYVTGTLAELRAFHARIGEALDREGVHECDEDEPCAVCDQDEDQDEAEWCPYGCGYRGIDAHDIVEHVNINGCPRTI